MARFAWIPLGTALAYGLALMLAPLPARPAVYVCAVDLLRVLAAVSCIRAAWRYSVGDRLHAAWILFACNLSLLLCKDLLFGQLRLWSGTPHAPLLRSVLVSAGNLTTVVAMVLLAGAWRSAGLAQLVSRRRQIGAALVAMTLAALTAGAAVAINVRELERGHAGALEHLASALGDFVTFSLVAPLALITFALRGGSLFWAWLFVVVSKLGWMLFDLLIGFGELLGLGSAHRLQPWTELLRCLALAAMLAAGLAQHAGTARRRL